MNPIKALWSTFTEIADSKKWIGSYVAAIFAAVLHVFFGVSVENALLLVSPISLGVLGQAHVDGKAAAAQGSGTIKEMAVGQLIEPGTIAPRASAPGEKLADAFETVTPTPG